MFLIYVNVLPNGLKSQCKLFGDGTSLFYIAYCINTCVSDISKDLKLITDWVFQWKMSFYADPCKQAQEVIISRKKIKAEVCISIILITVTIVQFQFQCTNIL